MNTAAGAGAGAPDGRTRAVILCPRLRPKAATARSGSARLEEATGLALAIDLRVVARETVPVPRIRAGSFFGSGTIERIADLVGDARADIVSVDAALTPVQQRTLENAWKAKVIDRTGLILEIFGARAHTREGALQVEFAHLTYQRSRLVRSWTHLERQRGGFGFLGGPGETQIEADRRMISERIARIRRDLEDVRKTRTLHRAARRRVPYAVVALVGYTNAGKTELFGRLTRSASVAAKDQLFATLDPAMRAARLPSGRTVILSDTVGFVSDLPTTLVAAFRATLEEVMEADVIVHVRDISHEDTEAQKEDVGRVLGELGIGPDGRDRFVEVLNKIDLLDGDGRVRVENLAARNGRAAAVSALTGENCDRLLEFLDDALGGDRDVVRLRVRHSDGAAASWLYRHSEVLDRAVDGDFIRFDVAIAAAELARFRNRFAVGQEPADGT